MQVKLVLQRNRLFVESPEKRILEKLLDDVDIKAAHQASGNAGIKCGQGRLDVAAAAIATTMQTIDLTKVPQDQDGEGGGGVDVAQPGLATSGGKQRGRGDEDDEEAEEAERSLEAGASGAKRTEKRAPAPATASATAAVVGSEQQPEHSAVQRSSGGTQGAESCAPKPVPHSDQSAIPEGGAPVELFSFEISPLHVRFPLTLWFPLQSIGAVGGTEAFASEEKLEGQIWPRTISPGIWSPGCFSPAALACCAGHAASVNTTVLSELLRIWSELYHPCFYFFR